MDNTGRTLCQKIFKTINTIVNDLTGNIFYNTKCFQDFEQKLILQSVLIHYVKISNEQVFLGTKNKCTVIVFTDFDYFQFFKF